MFLQACGRGGACNRLAVTLANGRSIHFETNESGDICQCVAVFQGHEREQRRGRGRGRDRGQGQEPEQPEGSDEEGHE